jgi:hypothetical protein
VVSFESLHCSPLPVQPGGVPIWFGGPASAIVARRVAELGAGWSPMGGGNLDEIARGVELIRRACAERGRDPGEIGIRAALPAKRDGQGRIDIKRTLAQAPTYTAAGVTTLLLPTIASLVTRIEDVEPFLRDALACLL